MNAFGKVPKAWCLAMLKARRVHQLGKYINLSDTNERWRQQWPPNIYPIFFMCETTGNHESHAPQHLTSSICLPPSDRNPELPAKPLKPQTAQPSTPKGPATLNPPTRRLKTLLYMQTPPAPKTHQVNLGFRVKAVNSTWPAGGGVGKAPGGGGRRLSLQAFQALRALGLRVLGFRL